MIECHYARTPCWLRYRRRLEYINSTVYMNILRINPSVSVTETCVPDVAFGQWNYSKENGYKYQGFQLLFSLLTFSFLNFHRGEIFKVFREIWSKLYMFQYDNFLNTLL